MENRPVRALLSVYDKTGIVEFAQGLVDLGWDIVSTGGTLSTLRDSGIPATSVSDVTGFPEILDGRVKTLHPKIHGGLLARTSVPSHVKALGELDIEAIGLLAGNLYPFEQTIERDGITDQDAIEQIDIGGPAMIRAAAKNHADVIVICDPNDYAGVLDEVRSRQIDGAHRRRLAAKAFAHVAAYDTLVADYLGNTDVSSGEWPAEISFAGRKIQSLRYGENPQQSAAAYHRLHAGSGGDGVLNARQLGGKELSFNNLLDADAAWNATMGMSNPAVAIVKHTIPCGLAIGADLPRAFDAALAGDPVSAFGGIVALNRPVDFATAERLGQTFFEVIVAPAYDANALELLSKKKNLRLLAMPATAQADHLETALDVRPIRGGLLIQTTDTVPANISTWTNATERTPTARELIDLEFAWAAVRHVKSNAIVLVRDRAVVGVGSGQPNRVESVRIAVSKAGDRAQGAVLAGDAFFPFADGLEVAIAAGVTAAVQPGGSVRDGEVIAAANRSNVAMVFTATRHFRH